MELIVTKNLNAVTDERPYTIGVQTKSIRAALLRRSYHPGRIYKNRLDNNTKRKWSLYLRLYIGSIPASIPG